MLMHGCTNDDPAHTGDDTDAMIQDPEPCSAATKMCILL